LRHLYSCTINWDSIVHYSMQRSHSINKQKWEYGDISFQRIMR